MRCECGESIEPGQKFCIGCGKSLDDHSHSDETSVLPPITQDGSLTTPSEPKKKRVWHKVVIAVVVVLALVLAGFGGFALWGMKSGDAGTSESDKDTVHYSDTKASKVRRKTVIVLYGKDGKPLERYELKVKDDSGDVTSHSVTDGQFTPESIGMEPDRQYTVVVDGSSDDVYNLPRIDVRPDDETSDDVHEDKLNVKPSENQDSSDDVSAACARRKMYLAFYDVIASMQSEYGEGEIATDLGADAGYLHGLSIVLLVDSDGDGEDDELITVHDDDNSKTDTNFMSWKTEGWTVQAWSYDSETGEASDWYKGNPVHSNGGWIFFEQAAAENGRVTLSDSEMSGYDADLEYTDYLLSPIGSQFSSGSGANHILISGEETLSRTQETINTIEQGMMADCSTSSATTKADKTDDAKSKVSYDFESQTSEVEFVYHNNEQNADLDESWSYVQFSSSQEQPDSALASINSTIKDNFERELQDAKEWNEDSSSSVQQCILHRETVTYLKDAYAVIRTERYLTLWGPHGDIEVTGTAYDLASGEKVSMSQIAGLSFSEMQSAARAAIKEYLSNNPSDLYDEDQLNEYIEQIINNESRYYVTEDGLLVNVMPSELGSYAYGGKDIVIAAVDGSAAQVGADLYTKYSETRKG